MPHILGVPGGFVPSLATLPEPDIRTVISYVSAAGRETFLTDFDRGMYVLPGATGLGLMPFTTQRVISPARNGSIPRGSRAEARDIFIPLAVFGNSRTEYRSVMQELTGDLDPRDGLGELHISEPDGTRRRIPCLYTGGMEGNEAADQAGLMWSTFGITFTADDPDFLDMTDVSQTWATAAAPTFFPIFPLRLAASQVLGIVTINVLGDEETYPLWHIHGPWTDIQLTQLDTGELIHYTAAGSSSDTLDLDTRPGVVSLIDQTGANKWGGLAANPVPWTLRKGINNVNLNISGATAGTSVTLAYTPRYKTAW